MGSVQRYPGGKQLLLLPVWGILAIIHLARRSSLRGRARSLTLRPLIGLVILLPVTIATAAGDSNPGQNDDLYRQHQRRTQEGAQASRSAPRSPSPRSPSDLGIQQLSIEEVLEVLGDEAVLGDTPSKPDANRDGQRIAPDDGQLLPLGGGPSSCLQKAFPEVEWIVCMTDMGLKALWVGPVYLKRTPISPWMKVLHQAGLAEIFVPYHQIDFRPYDLRFPDDPDQLEEVTAADAGSNGSLITLPGTVSMVPTVVAEVRDRGVAWLCKEDAITVRRGEEFLVWGVRDGGNYDNIIQYGFRDDGAMTFRLGVAGFNNPIAPFMAHMHSGLWRVDMDLNGLSNSASLLQHEEPDMTSPLRATDTELPFPDNSGVEGAAGWDDLQFTSLLIEHNDTNVHGNKLGYEFMPLRLGTARHYGVDDEQFTSLWTQSDFYVTVYHPNELNWTTPTGWLPPDQYLLNHISNSESVTNNDLIVWLTASAHHEPHDEDRHDADVPQVPLQGVTLVHWSGFNVEPHNLFAANPMGAPLPCGSSGNIDR
jgi:hypothetical protein